jgi:hypothetical protein
VWAAYTKLYSFTNTTGASQTSAKATLTSLKSITASTSVPAGWSTPPKPTIGSTVISGVYCTTINFGTSPSAANGTSVTVGWSTSGNACRLRDLRWGGGQAIVPTALGGVPGGGMVFYDYPSPGCLTVVITNDNPDPAQVLDLTQIEYGIAPQALTLEQLAELTNGAGLVELRVAAIDKDIEVLRAEVIYYGSLGILPSPSVRSLTGKLDSAVYYKHAGLTVYLKGDTNKALFYWNKAASQVANFISQITTESSKGNIPDYLYDRWAIDGDGEITAAPELRDALLALPEGATLFNFPGLPAGTPWPSYAGLDPNGYVAWPTTTLNPGEYTAFVVCNPGLGAGFIMGGTITDGSGNSLLDWIEQGVAEPTVLDTEPPVITSASATPGYLWSPNHSMVEIALEVTVSDNSYAAWYIESVTSNQAVDATGSGDTSPDWYIDPENPQLLWLRSERSGSDPIAVRLYTITLMAIDTGGNLSAPYQLVIPVNHDQNY